MIVKCVNDDWSNLTDNHVGKMVLKVGDPMPEKGKEYEVIGYINHELKLSDREWTCLGCGSKHDRDHNAAKNIKSFGLEAKPSTVKTVRKVKSMGCEKMPLSSTSILINKCGKSNL